MLIEKRENPTGLEEAKKLTSSTLIATIVANRIKGTDISAERIMNSSKDELDRYIGIDDETVKGASILKEAIDNNKNVWLVTDSDCDGISSASVGALWFKEEYGIDVNVMINLREYGNGVNETILSLLQVEHEKKPIDLIITADHGSADEPRYKDIKKLMGSKIIVTDHHLVPTAGRPTSVDAFINPQDSASKLNKQFCGAVVLYMLFRELNPTKECDYLFPILGMATSVDMMALNMPANRYIINKGLSLVTESKPFIHWLDNKYGKYITPSIFNRGLGPMINSTNRLMEPEVGFQFLTSCDTDRVQTFDRMDLLNSRRMSETKVIKDIAKLSLNKDLEKYSYSATAIVPDGEGLIGLVASQLGDVSNRPTIVFTKSYEGEVYKGSGRAVIPSFSMFDLIERCRDANILIGGGGHAAAGGLSVKQEHFEKFREIFETYAKEATECEFTLWYDMNLPIALLKDSTFEHVERLEPFGHKFEDPRFRITGQMHNISKTSYMYKYTIISAGELIELKSYNKLINSDMLHKDMEFVVSMRKDVRRGIVIEILGCKPL